MMRCARFALAGLSRRARSRPSIFASRFSLIRYSSQERYEAGGSCSCALAITEPMEHAGTPLLRSASTRLPTTKSIFLSLATSLSFHLLLYLLLRSTAYANKNSYESDARWRAR
jgi:hypothetical protein